MIIKEMKNFVLLRAEAGMVLTDEQGGGPWRVKCVAPQNVEKYCEMTEADYWEKFPAPEDNGGE